MVNSNLSEDLSLQSFSNFLNLNREKIEDEDYDKGRCVEEHGR